MRKKGRVFKCQSNFKRIFVDLRDTERRKRKRKRRRKRLINE